MKSCAWKAFRRAWWLTILNKREAFRAGFAHFDAEQVARFGAADVQRLLGDAGIVRHRGKIESAIQNAQRVLELRREFGSLAHYVWRFAPAAAEGAPAASRWSRCAPCPPRRLRWRCPRT